MTQNEKTSSIDATIWARRKAALSEIAKEIAKDLEPDKKEIIEIPVELQVDVSCDDPQLWEQFQPVYARRQRETCRRLWNLLLQFAENAASFLEESDTNNEDLPLRYLWRVLLNGVSTDIRIFQAAFEQRTLREVKQPDNAKSTDFSSRELINPLASTLFMADIISEHALGQAVESRFLKQTPIVTYLKEDISIRPVPYAKVALISVAYASMLGSIEINSYRRVSRDMLAIPHEVGHHLFWKGQMPGKRRSIKKHLQKRLKRAQIYEWDWRHAWLEEIFADAYGLLVAGPVMALSFQDLLTDNLPSQFIKDTGQHPIPALRPYIHNRILHGITDAGGNLLYKSAPKLLDQRWEKWLADEFPRNWANADPLKVEYKLNGVVHPLQGWRILEELDEMIAIILRTLRGQRPSRAGANWTHGSWKAWTTDVQDEKELLGLFDNLTFKNFPLSSHWLNPALPEEDVTVQTSSEDLAIQAQEWQEKISSGWSVEGPEDRGGG